MPRPPGAELAHNTALIADPAGFAREHRAASWLHLCGEESLGDSPALTNLYEGLRSGESAEQVLDRAESEGAPFVHSAECRAWVEQGVRELPA